MPKAFLITPFTPERAGNEDPEVFEAVQNAVTEAAMAAGVELMHPANLSAAGVIMDHVREAIEKADVVLAILTGQNPNVFYEMGIALERASRPAILIVRSPQDVPFDVRHHRFWTYGGNGELQRLAHSLEQAIRETLALTPRPTGYPQPPLYLRLVELTRETRFFYGARAAPFLGREREMEELQKFVQSEASFQWWLLLGPGGQGKSRLALELCLQQRMSWHAGFLGDTQFNWHTWRPERPTLIVVDYAAGRAEQLHTLALTLYDRRTNLDFPVRLLLIEREMESERETELPWYSTFLGYGGDRHAITAVCYREEALKLGGLDDDALWHLMLSIFDQTGYLPPERNDLLTRLREIDNEERPLFAALLADALASGRLERDWDRATLIRDILKREEATYWKAAGITPEDKHLLVLATMTGGLPVGRLPIAEAADLLPSHRTFSPDRYQVISGKPAEETLAPLEPDLLGELFALDFLAPAHAADKWRVERLWGVAWREAPQGMSRFLSRTAEDFPDHSTFRFLTRPPILKPEGCRETPELSHYWASAAISMMTHLRDVVTTDDLRALYDNLASLAKACPDDQLLREIETEAIFHIAVSYAEMGNLNEAHALYDRLASLAESHPAEGILRENQVRVAFNLSAHYLNSRRFENARNLYNHVAKLADSHPDEPMLGGLQVAMLKELICAYGDAGDLSEAYTLYEQLKQSSKTHSHPFHYQMEAVSTVCLVRACCAAGRVTEARGHYSHLVILTANHPDDGVFFREQQAKGALHLITLLAETGGLNEANELYNQLALLAEEASPDEEILLDSLAEALFSLASAFGGAGRLDDARSIHNRLAALSEAHPELTSIRGFQVTSLFNLVLAYANTGDLEAARIGHEQLVHTFQENPNPTAREFHARLNASLIEPFCSAGDVGGGRILYNDIAALANQYPDEPPLREWQAQAAVALITACGGAGDVVEARTLYNEVAALANRHPDEPPLREWQAKNALAFIIAFGDASNVVEARALYNDIATLCNQFPEEAVLIEAQAFAVLHLMNLYERLGDSAAREALVQSVYEDPELSDAVVKLLGNQT